MSRPYTKEEARDAFLSHVKAYVEYWEKLPVPSKEKLEGLAFSILCIFDGSAAMHPAMNISTYPHPDDKAYCESRGENWYEDGMAINDDVQLHEEWSRKYSSQSK